ncbi:MAG TPA: acyl-CoA thioesterase [Anaerolineae bacterium]|nr:acyl-CoA thioesterase [Anaerolineae bacterium]HXV99481.1 acyl-CoA thioesterase [Anaerolineae bacterium]
MSGKQVKDSQITLNQLMLPHHTNPMGSVHGGEIMRLVDETAALCAIRHAQRPVVTIAIDSMTFHSPVHVGNLVSFYASLNWVGRSSMEVGVRVVAENVLTGEQTHTNSAFVVYIALDDSGRPTEVPRLILETEEERRRWVEAEARQQRRLERQRAKEESARNP